MKRGFGLALGPFRLADHSAPARPAVERRIAEVLVAAGGLAGRGSLRLGLQEFHGDLLDEPLVAGEAEHEVHPVLFAQTISASRANPDLARSRMRVLEPPRPDLADNAGDFLDRAGAAVDVRRPEPRRQEMPAAEHIQGQIAVAVVIAVKEPAFLMAVQRVVGRVEVENDLLGRPSSCRSPCVRLEEEVDKQRLDRRRVVADLVIARGRHLARQFQPVQRRFARCRRAVVAPGFELARQHRHQRVVTKLVVIVQVFVAERDAETRCPMSVMTECSTNGPLASRKHPASRRTRPRRRSAAADNRPPASDAQRAAVELGHHRPAFDPSKGARFCATLCPHRATFANWRKSSSQNNFCLILEARCATCVRFAD